MRPGYTYSQVGIDVAKIAHIHEDIDRILSQTYQTRRGKIGRVLNIRQHYAGLVKIGGDQVLAIHSDGVGTKVLVAEALGKYDTVGIDCVAMNVNDVICLGAEPIALANYLALSRARPKLVVEVMRGLRRGANEAGVAVVAGETAILPDLVHGFDLAGTIIGVVRRDKIITGEKASVGDAILGLPSSGIHSNGLTLARRVLLSGRFDRRVAKELLRPTRIYVKPIRKLLSVGVKIHGLAHITGGAFSKLKRIGQRANVGFQLDHFPSAPLIFRKIQGKGRVSDAEMFRTFNMGIGFIVISPKTAVAGVKALLPEIKTLGSVTDSRTVTVMMKGKDLEIEKY
jgi:phosphoribosylformylglycinamidine cyclo-ligase